MDRLVGFKIQTAFAEIDYFAGKNILMGQKIVQNNGFIFEPSEFSALNINIHSSPETSFPQQLQRQPAVSFHSERQDIFIESKFGIMNRRPAFTSGAQSIITAFGLLQKK
jgi:hypothetical protein